MSKKFEPLFRTPEAEMSEAEANKFNSNQLRGDLAEEFRNEEADLTWSAEQLAKSYGIYLEYNRTKAGKEKDWIYMIRLGIPGGGPISPKQWALLDELANQYGVRPDGEPSLRLTTRQAVQFHWVKKEGVIPIVARAAEAGFFSLNACGDNVRNVMACPFGGHTGLFDGRVLAEELSRYFQLPSAAFVQIFALDPNAIEQDYERFQYGPRLLNRKFKIAVGGLIRNQETGLVENENCVELRTHDLGIAPVWGTDQLAGFQIYVGGGQGEKYGKPTQAMLAKPFAYTTPQDLLKTVSAVVSVHQEWGDRKNRHWARLKYLVTAQGIDWLREQVTEVLGQEPTPPLEDFDPGPRHLHHGVLAQANGKYAYGAWIENGRLVDAGENGRLKSMIRELSEKYQSPLILTANQDVLFTDLEEAQLADFQNDLAGFGFGKRHGHDYSPLRLNSGACVGRDTCRLAYTESEGFEPELIDSLEALGWRDLQTSIGITGCERQCFRPATKAIGLVGSGLNRYQLKVGGTEDCRHQGGPLVEDGKAYLRSVPRDRVPQLLDTLFKWYETEKVEPESLGYFLRRQGNTRILSYIQGHEAVADLAEKGLPHLAVTTEVDV